MLQFTGTGLGKRHQELNELVHKTALQKVDLNTLKALEEQSDVDRIYKIKVASAYNNVDYIVETLKSGDTLYISKALKCTWLYESRFAHVINPDYIHHEIFPFMSKKMMNKFLTAISIHVRDEDRALDFYKYCLNQKLQQIALKFLIWTSEKNKMEYIRDKVRIEKSLQIQFFFSTSFDLVDIYLKNIMNNNMNTNSIVHEFSYLYSVSNEKYLDLMEKYTSFTEDCFSPPVPMFGLRLSKDIVIKHKDRIFNNLQLYFQKINIDLIARHTNIENAKKYAIGLLPSSAEEFWNSNFYEKYKPIINLLPHDTIFSFLREIFLSKYSGELFEMSPQFFRFKYYQLLSTEERETWALEHLKRKQELLGPGNDFLWYQFVNYDLALKEIKKYIYVTTDPEKRARVVRVLIQSVKKDERQLENLLNYYYERFVNEKDHSKKAFIDAVIDENNVFNFSDSCWNAFNKILCSCNVYTPSDSNMNYKGLCIIYHIIHHKEVPTVLKVESINYSILPYYQCYFSNLTDEQKYTVYQYLMDICVNKFKCFDSKTYDNIVKEEIRDLVEHTISILECFAKTRDDCPEIVLKYVKLDWDQYKSHNFFCDTEEVTPVVSEGLLLRLLKKDSKLLLQELSDLSHVFKQVTVNNLLKKIRIYFANDIAQDLIHSCEKLLIEVECHEMKIIKAIVYCIFQIARQDYKIAFMSKSVPEDAKISHDKIDRKLLYVQEGICRYANCSRPPVPLTSILNYIKGDYAHFCLPLFYSYQANLPEAQFHQFISAILDAPLSIRKHGLRLAFHNFNLQDLKKLITDSWENTKNVSLRSTIYTALFNKINNVDDESARELYKVLKMYNLNENVFN